MNNSNHSSFPSIYTEYHLSLLLWVAIVLTINVLGSVANIVTFIATLTYRPLRKFTSCFNLAHCILNDTFTCFIIEPGVVITLYLGSSLPTNLCRWWGPIVYVTFFANNWAHAVLAISRFIAAVFPHEYKRLTTRNWTVFAILFPWIISLLLNVFPMAEIKSQYFLSTSWSACLLGRSGDELRVAVITLGNYLPACIIGLCYSVILTNARSRLRRRVGDVLRHGALVRRYEISRMLFLSFLWFCLSNFSTSLGSFLYPTTYSASPLTQLGLKGLQYVCSALNPVCTLSLFDRFFLRKRSRASM